MLGNVFIKSLRDERVGMAWWMLGISALVGVVVAVFPTIEANLEFNELLQAYPEALKTMMGLRELSEMTSAVGFLNAELFGLMAPLLVLIHGVTLGSRSIAGEEGDGTLEVLLSEPITRRRILIQKFAANCVTQGFLAATFCMALVIGSLLIDMDVSIWSIIGASFNLLVFGLTFGTMAFAVGCWTGRRSLSVALTVGFATTSYLVIALSSLVDSMEIAKWLSPFFYYSDGNPLANGINPLYVVILLSSCAVLLCGAYLVFERRDIRL
jgi:ABC-2 type transport system permease protein